MTSKVGEGGMNMKTLDMEVVDIRKVVGDGKIKAFDDLKLSEAYVVKGFKVVKGPTGIFVGMPSKPGKNGQWFETLVPATESVREALQNKVLEAYDHETDGVTA